MRRALAGLACAALLTGCGSTVQIRSSDLVTSDGLGGGGLGGAPGAVGEAPDGLVVSPGEVSRDGTVVGGVAPVPARGAGGTSGATPARRAPDAVAVPTAGSAVKGPITVGMLVTTASGLDSTGYSPGNTVNEQAVDEALVKALNARGGLDGHQIKPIFAETDTFSSSWEGDFSAACAKFTQDGKVQAVLGYAFNYYASFERCLAKRGIPHLTTSFNIPDRKELADFPSFVAVDTPTVDRRGLAKVDGAMASGYLTKSNKLGILTDSCPGSVRSLEQVVLPFIARSGLPKPKVYTVNCVNGYADSGSSSAELSSAQLSFASNGVDRVMPYGVSEGPGLAQFTITAESQGYRPGYIVSSLANLALNNGTIPPAQARGIRGFGWLPMEDVPPADYGPLNSNQKRCVALLASQRITLSSTADYVYAWQICEPFFVYEAALKASGGRVDAASVVAGIRGLGSSYTSVTNLAGEAQFSPGRSDAIVSARPLVYADACACWRYTGPSRVIPES